MERASRLSRRRRAAPAAAAFLLAVTGLARGEETAPAKPLNFLVILADDLGAKELASYGHKEHRTPNLDRLAAEGMRFETCWSAPLCTPSRLMLMTGQYGFRTGYYNNLGGSWTPRRDSPLYDVGSKLTFADLLKGRGYATALAGKWQLTGKVPEMVRDCGFDEHLMWAYKQNLPPGVEHTGAWESPGGRTSRYWHPCLLRDGKYVLTKPEDYGPAMFTDFLIDFIRRHRDGPFIAYATMCQTHAPHDPTPDLARPGARTEGGLANNLEYLDHLVGRLVRALDELDLRRRTLVIFTGDNGTGGDGKGTTTELGVRVPLIVSCPGTVPAGVVSGELASLTDIFPTLADFAGAAAPAGHTIDGKSLANVLRGGKAGPREWLFSYLKNERMLRDKRWLLQGDGRLFDCGSSRDGAGYREVTDLADTEAAAARRRFEAILRDLPPPRPEEQELRLEGRQAAE